MHQYTLDDLKKVKWYHQFEILPGLITPGHVGFHASQFLDDFGFPKDLTGMRVLDIGAWDGPMSFELEKRGAEVYAVDVQNPDETAFNFAKEILKSKVPYLQASVYDLPMKLDGKFDLICYWGVYYHLKHPIYGFEIINKMLRMGGKMFFEGELFIHYAETVDGIRSKNIGRKVGESNVPLSLCYVGKYRGVSNWFIPNLAALKMWIEACGMKITSYKLWDDETFRPSRDWPVDIPMQRISGVAEKVSEDINPEIVFIR